MHITCFCLSTTIQRTAVFDSLKIKEVNRSSRFRLDASGKAINISRVFNQLDGTSSSIVCPIGSENSNHFIQLSQKDKLSINSVFIPGFTRECVTIIEENSKNVTELVMDEETPCNTVIFKQKEKELIEAAINSFKASDALAFAGSRPKVWSKNINSTVCKTALEKGLTVLVDFWGFDLLFVLQECTPDIIKINAKEFCETFELPCEHNEKELLESICKKSKELNNCIVVTRGKNNTLAAYKGTPYIQPIEEVTIVNSIGCGDSFSAGFLYEYLVGKSHNGEINIQKALEKGTWCAARNAECEKIGSLY